MHDEIGLLERIANELTRNPKWVDLKYNHDMLDATFKAGAALRGLDVVLRSEFMSSLAWRRRQALLCASGVLKVRETGLADLRSGFLSDAADFHNSGRPNLVVAWRKLSEGWFPLDRSVLIELCVLIDQPWKERFCAALDAATTAASEGNPLAAATSAALQIRSVDPEALLLALWVADWHLARGLRWPVPVPLLASRIGATGDFSRIWRESTDADLSFHVTQCLILAGTEAFELAIRMEKRITLASRVALGWSAEISPWVLVKLSQEDSFKVSSTATENLLTHLQTCGAVSEYSKRQSDRIWGL